MSKTTNTTNIAIPAISGVQLTTGVLTLVTALAWNAAGISVVDYIYPQPRSQVIATVAYALILTILVVIIIMMFNWTCKKYIVELMDESDLNEDYEPIRKD